MRYRNPRCFSPLYCIVAPREDVFAVTRIRRNPVTRSLIDEVQDPNTYSTAHAAIAHAVEVMDNCRTRQRKQARYLEKGM
ncbi:hypothetical protein GCM10009618_08620 [Nesterenkonia lacusekhoensis]